MGTIASLSTNGHAALHILFLDGGLDGTWTPNSDYIKIDTNEGSENTPNGLATPAIVDIDGDYTADLIYAGDLTGNLWKFDVRDPDPMQWKTPGAQKLFEAPPPNRLRRGRKWEPTRPIRMVS